MEVNFQIYLNDAVNVSKEEIMLTQNEIRILSKIFSDYGYVMTTAQLINEKLFYRDIQRMLEQGLIERIKRGCYHWVDDYGTSEVVIVNRLFPDAVLCMETALFYYRYSDRNPAEWNITIDKNTSRKRTNIDYPFIKAYRVEPELLFSLWEKSICHNTARYWTAN